MNVKEKAGSNIEIKSLLSSSGEKPPLVINKEEDLKIVYQNFQWVSPEIKDTRIKTISEMYQESAQELERLGLVSEASVFFTQINNRLTQAAYLHFAIQQTAFSLSKDQQPDEYRFLCHYHNIGYTYDQEKKIEESLHLTCDGHVEYVTAMGLKLFKNLVSLTRDGQRLQEITNDKNLALEYKKLFGKNWQKVQLTEEHLQQLTALLAFHESGDWWPLWLWKKEIDKQRALWQKQPDTKVLSLKEQILATLQADKTLETQLWIQSNNEQMKSWEQVTRGYIGNLGIEITSEGDRSLGDPITGFNLHLQGTDPKSLGFQPFKSMEDTESSAELLITRLVLIADYVQCHAPSYLQPIEYPDSELEKPLGPGYLRQEFIGLKPNALPKEWRGFENAGMDSYFFNNFYTPFVGNMAVLRLLDEGNEGVYHQQHQKVVRLVNGEKDWYKNRS